MVLPGNIDYQLRMHQEPFVGRALPEPVRGGQLTSLPKSKLNYGGPDVCSGKEGKRGQGQKRGEYVSEGGEKKGRNKREKEGTEGERRTYLQFMSLLQSEILDLPLPPSLLLLFCRPISLIHGGQVL